MQKSEVDAPLSYETLGPQHFLPSLGSCIQAHFIHFTHFCGLHGHLSFNSTPWRRRGLSAEKEQCDLQVEFQKLNLGSWVEKAGLESSDGISEIQTNI